MCGEASLGRWHKIDGLLVNHGRRHMECAYDNRPPPADMMGFGRC
jgi:hypothetical protein